jgi:hypothetical protein
MLAWVSLKVATGMRRAGVDLFWQRMLGQMAISEIRSQYYRDQYIKEAHITVSVMLGATVPKI